MIKHDKQLMFVEGGSPLSGTVAASGAKNAALPILAACILTNGSFQLTNIPNLADIHVMVSMLNELGVNATFTHNTVQINNASPLRHTAPYHLVTSMRASFFVAGPLLAKTGRACVPLPGGCAIGTRPIDIHLDGFKKLGATIQIDHGNVSLSADTLRGADIHLSYPSVGATENILMAACLAEGTSCISNAAQEPEVTDLCHFLNKAGAKISGINSTCLKVEGVSSLKGLDYNIIPDRIEIGTLMLATLMTKGAVHIKHIVAKHLSSLVTVLKQMGAHIKITQNSLFIEYTKPLSCSDIETHPFPGFPTDMQAQMMALFSVIQGTSSITETVFENRFQQAQELKRMGADIRILKDHAIIQGIDQLSSAEVKMSDLRAGAALVNAALVAKGTSKLFNLYHLQRGYECYWEKLNALGAKIRVN